ncbi:DNA-methyltransferase [Xanthobacter versatilis]|uniref:DNA-methyltransferase n=1 Tax=Xanthobacter autotrophicus (strain ATCC BAA-1158 / Py2) TaxID=78245 RepID=UPI00372774A0
MLEPETFLEGSVTLHCGDSRDVLRTLPEASIHSVVCDPPYALVSIGKRFGRPGAAPAQHGTDGLYARASAGFMGQAWDTGETAFAVGFWAEVLRVLKPGGHLVAFSGTRTYHRMVCAIEDAGFEIRDQLAWMYGTGFNKRGYIFRDADGKPTGPWGGALKPAWEPIVLARKALTGTVADAVLEHGTGALNIDGCRIEGGKTPAPVGQFRGSDVGAAGLRGERNGSQDSLGRWPANILHDGSPDVVEGFPKGVVKSAAPRAIFKGRSGSDALGNTSHALGAESRKSGSVVGVDRGDGGSASRFFYSAKADADDRLGSKHPTVKPVDLMQWLCRLVCPPGGVILDPFAGTGTTGEAAWREGFSAVLIERESAYQTDIRRRMALCLAGPEERKRESIKARHGDVDAGPLFSNVGAAE